MSIRLREFITFLKAEGIYELYMLYARNEYNDHYRNLKTYSFKEFVAITRLNAFEWSGTKEGNDFWAKMEERYCYFTIYKIKYYCH